MCKASSTCIHFLSQNVVKQKLSTLDWGESAKTPKIQMQMFDSKHYIEKSGRHHNNQVTKVNSSSNKRYQNHVPLDMMY